MISVVIPLYNKASVIKNTIQSVLAQSYNDFEVVIVNDGSTDGSVEVINSNFRDSRIRIINQANGGVSSARNRGVMEAKYDYIAFLDGDDEWLPDYLFQIQQAIDSHPNAGMFCCAGLVRNADGSILSRTAKKYQGKILSVNFFENPHVFLHTSATVVAKKIFEMTEGFPLGMKRNQDYALFFTVALITEVVYLGLPLSIYVGGVPGQATSTPMREVLPHVVKRYNLVYDKWLETGCRNRIFLVFMLYELRHTILTNLRNKEYSSNEFLLNNLNPLLLKHFTAIELLMYNYLFLRPFSIYFILITKVRWRLRGFPYFGQKVQ